MEHRQENPPKQSPNRLVQLLEARPLIFWGGMWASLALVAAVSVSSLVSPGLMGSGQTASGAAIGSSGNTVAQPASPSTAPTKNSFPFWLFSAIALSCTAGSILVSKQLAPPRSRRILRPQPTQQRYVKQKPPKQKQSQPVAPPQAVPIQATKVQATKVRKAAPSRHAAPSPQPSVRRSARRASPSQVPARSVAIVPQAVAHPLDWKTPSIADSMDLRKQRSLASWL